MKKESTALALVSTDHFVAFNDETNELIIELIREFFADGLGEDDLHTVKIPTGGGQSWDLPGDQSARTFTSIIVGEQMTRSYWPEPFSGTGQPSACSSKDGLMGVGDPGGPCSMCSYSQWGSGRNGIGQACQQRKILYILSPEDTLPMRLILPATSFGNLRKFYRDLLNKRVSRSGVVCEFGLMKTQNKTGITYSQATFKISDLLDKETAMRGKAYASVLARAMGHGTPIDAEPKAPPRHDLDEDDIPDFDFAAARAELDNAGSR